MNREETTHPEPPQRPISGLPVDTDLLFADRKGNYSPRMEKKRTKLLRKLGFLAPFLEPGETIVFVTTGCSPFSNLEQITVGYALLPAIKRSLFVFTDRRIFHVPTTAKYEYRGSIAQILYHDCEKLYVKGSSLRAEYRTGRKETFCGIPRADRATIKQLQIDAPELSEPSDCPERNHLCPRCASMLKPRTTDCPECGLPFKTEAEAIKYSLLFPGGGYFYVRRPLLGALDAIGETYLILLTLVSFIDTFRGRPGAAPVFVMIGILLAIEKAVTIYHTRRFLAEFIPRETKVTALQRHASPEPAGPPPAPERTHSIEEILSLR